MPAKNSLFQQGGWATQLSCDNPALVSWLKYIEGARQTACSVLGVECTTQDNRCEQVHAPCMLVVALLFERRTEYIVLAVHFAPFDCISDAFLCLCMLQWTPLAIILTAVAVLLLAVYLLAILLSAIVDSLLM